MMPAKKMAAPGSRYMERSHRARAVLPAFVGRLGRVWTIDGILWKATNKSVTCTKSTIGSRIAEATGLKKKDCLTVITAMTEVLTSELKHSGKAVLPGIGMLKLRSKPPTKAGVRKVFGKDVMVKEKPAKLIVKAIAATSLKKAVETNTS